MQIELDDLHHSYLIVGTADMARSELDRYFSEKGVMLTGSPDFFYYHKALFGIDEARALSQNAIRKAFTGRKIFLITPEKITLEAQNALLKTFEEPIDETHFFLVVREESIIIPTLLSRMEIWRLKNSTETHGEAGRFLSLSLKERQSFIKKFVVEERNLPAFLDDLLLFLKKNREKLTTLEKVYKIRLLSDDRAVAPRLILEHLSLVL